MAVKDATLLVDILGTIEFSPTLHAEFARLSGDWNPMHMDPTAARRTQAGRPVVHGIHTVLSILENFAGSSPNLGFPSKLTVKFVKPVYLNEPVEFQKMRQIDRDFRMRAVVDGISAVELQVTVGESRRCDEKIQCGGTDDNVLCREVPFAELAGCCGMIRVVTTEEKIACRFPNLARWLGTSRIGGLLCLSRLVGMECPGLHSLFSGFTVEFLKTQTPSCLEYRVVSVDPRFRLVKIDVNGIGLRGDLDAFARQPPVAQMSVRELSDFVEPDEFASQRVLVVGGSRGLGEFTAKALAAGGGNPIITYATAKEEAERVADEISQWGGICDILKYDVRVPSGEQLVSLAPSVSYLYYYPTCQIFPRRSKQFDYALLEEFLRFYVSGFYDLCSAIKKLCPQRMCAFYPSSVSVEQRPRDMTEYAMAKAAGEILCSDLDKFVRGIHILCVRLPRLLTDQTATLVPTETAEPLNVILPIIRQFQAIRF